MSPPPATETSLPASVSSAAASAISIVASSNGSISKAPTGPFHSKVFDRASAEMTCSTLRGPRSRIISSSPTASTATTLEGACGASSRATTASVGSRISRPLASAAATTSRAVVTRSCSASDLPMRRPWAARKVLAMPPPIARMSTLAIRLPNRSSLVETFAPPTIAITGCAGCSRAFSRASSSACMARPA